MIRLDFPDESGKNTGGFFFDRCEPIGVENWSLQGISLAPKEPFGFQPWAFCHQLHPVPGSSTPQERAQISLLVNYCSQLFASLILSPLFLRICWLWRRVLTYILQLVCPAQNQLQTFPLESCVWMAAWPSSSGFFCHLVPYLILSCWSLKWQCLVFL